ncbi:MAG: LemA family protein, partial [Endomicrobia bacterium]|nr:LemA family protein [Endomicrobiia bacterium]
NENFIRLQDELAGTENRIATERRRYNEVVKEYNILVQRFPSNIVAKIAGFEKKDIYFEAKQEAKETPKVEF